MAPSQVRALPPTVDYIDPELIALYMEETKQPERIVTAFLRYDLEPPHRDTTTTMGFTSYQNRILDATRYTEPDPLDEDPSADLNKPKGK